MINYSALRFQNRRASKCSTVVAVGKARNYVAQPQIQLVIVGLSPSRSTVEATRCFYASLECPKYAELPTTERADGVSAGLFVDQQVAALVARQSQPLPMQGSQGTAEYRVGGGGNTGQANIGKPSFSSGSMGAVAQFAPR